MGRGAVFALTNALGGNAVVMYQRAADGSLSPAGEHPAGGVGTGTGLGSQGAVVNPSAGQTPFGFAIGKRNTLLISEAGVGGGASTYRVDDGNLEAISAMVVTGQRAACWAVITSNGKFGYVTNASTGNISGVAISREGSASLLDADGVTAVTGGNPTDVAMSRNGRYRYARVAALSQIAIFRVRAMAPSPRCRRLLVRLQASPGWPVTSVLLSRATRR